MVDLNKVNVKIKKLHLDAVIPQYARAMDAGFDLVSIEDVVIAPGNSGKIPTGLAFALPEGWELQVRPRSGIASKTKLRLSNAPGTVDAGYRGEVGVLIDNIRQHSIYSSEKVFLPDEKLADAEELFGEGTTLPIGTYFIPKGTRIAQGVIVPVARAIFEEVDELDETERGAGGFGSSGVRA